MQGMYVIAHAYSNSHKPRLQGNGRPSEIGHPIVLSDRQSPTREDMPRRRSRIVRRSARSHQAI